MIGLLMSIITISTLFALLVHTSGAMAEYESEEE